MNLYSWEHKWTRIHENMDEFVFAKIQEYDRTYSLILMAKTIIYFWGGKKRVKTIA